MTRRTSSSELIAAENPTTIINIRHMRIAQKGNRTRRLHSIVGPAIVGGLVGGMAGGGRAREVLGLRWVRCVVRAYRGSGGEQVVATRDYRQQSTSLLRASDAGCIADLCAAHCGKDGEEWLG